MKEQSSHRPVIVIDFQDKNAEILHPQFAVLAGENGASNGKRYLGKL